MFFLMNKTHQTLESLRVTHFLCFDSLLGAMELGPLPWRRDGQLCAISSIALTTDEPAVLRAFRRRELRLEYSAEGGLYWVEEAGVRVEVGRV